jgi:hypothetical protein
MCAQMFPCLPHLETLVSFIHLLQKQNLLPGKQKYFLPNSETLMKHSFSVCRRWYCVTDNMTNRNIGKTNNQGRSEASEVGGGLEDFT